MQVTMEERECESCGKTFVTSEQDTSEFCSWTCKQ